MDKEKVQTQGIGGMNVMSRHTSFEDDELVKKIIIPSDYVMYIVIIYPNGCIVTHEIQNLISWMNFLKS